jgi:hypothetical protein
MASGELVDEAFDGTREFAHFDADGNLVALQWQSDVEPVIEANKRAQTNGTRGWSASREWRHVASIPPALLLKFATERCGNSPGALRFINSREGFEEIILKMTRDPDYRWLRTDI